LQAKLTQTFVNTVSPSEKLLRIRDTNTVGLVLFVNPGGKKTYFVDYKRLNGKRADHKIGDAALFTVAEAREAARKFLASIQKGKDPSEPPKPILTLGTFLSGFYEPWVLEYRKSGKATLAMIKANFEYLFDMPVENIPVTVIEQWRAKKKKDDGVKASSLNRIVTALRAAIGWGIKREIIASNPLVKLEPLSERDSVKKVRYLSDDERARLMAALDEREEKIRSKRENHNKWLEEREYDTLPGIKKGAFADYVKPVVILALSTGIRRNSLLSLEWRDVNLAERVIHVRADTAKNDKEYYVPMSDLAFDTLSRWHKQAKRTAPHNLVFPSPKSGKKMCQCDTAWRSLLKKAGVENFRWHDMRHDFASRLVMRGADLNTVRELLGHTDLKMTVRYAHLAPEHKLQAVKLLD
jgi:integrase